MSRIIIGRRKTQFYQELKEVKVIILLFTLKAFPYAFPLRTKEQNKFLYPSQSNFCLPPIINPTVIKCPMEEKTK